MVAAAIAAAQSSAAAAFEQASKVEAAASRFVVPSWRWEGFVIGASFFVFASTVVVVVIVVVVIVVVVVVVSSMLQHLCQKLLPLVEFNKVADVRSDVVRQPIEMTSHLDVDLLFPVLSVASLV